MPSRLRLAAPLVAIAFAAAAAADVLVVEEPPGAGSYGTIQAAVDDAADGDVILVRYGSIDGYPGFFVNGKAIDVVGEPGFGQRPVVAGSVRVTNVPAGKRVLLSGLDVHGVTSSALYAGYGLWAFSNDGRVRVQDCALVGADNADEPSNCSGLGDETGWEGALLTDSADVAFSHSTLTGGVGLSQKQSIGGCWEETSGGDGGHALAASNAIVTMYECELFGGAGGYGATGDGAATGTTGGNGAFVQGGTLFASGTYSEGGRGGVFFDILALPVPGGAGGHGLQLSPGTTSTMIDCELVGGDGAPGIFGAPDGADGLPWLGGTLTPLLGDARDFVCASPHPEAQPLLMQFTGDPMDEIFVLLGLGDEAFPLPVLLHGVLLVANPYVVNIGPIDPSGFLSAVVPIPALDLGVQSVTLPLQAVFVQPDLTAYLGPQKHLVLLDSAF